MSADASPITAAHFAAALKDLGLPSLGLKVLELRNSLAHLEYSNAQLETFAVGAVPDPDCVDAIAENRVVMARMQERIGLVRAEVEGRGCSWLEFESEEERKARREGGGGSESENGSGSGSGNGSGSGASRLPNGQAGPGGDGDGDGDRDGNEQAGGPAWVNGTNAPGASATPATRRTGASRSAGTPVAPAALAALAAPATPGVTSASDTSGTTGMSRTSGTPGTSGTSRTSGTSGTHQAWTDGTFQTGVFRNGELHLSEATAAPDASPTGGTLSDEDLRRMLEERMGSLGEDDEGGRDDSGGLHL